MKNDFDFIKEKFENSGVAAPENMGVDFALDIISDVEPDNNDKNPRLKLRKITAIAASFAVVIAVMTASVFLFSKPEKSVSVKKETIQPSSAKPAEVREGKEKMRTEKFELNMYSNRDELIKKLGGLGTKYNFGIGNYDMLYYSPEAPNPSSGGGFESNPEVSRTYNRTEEIEEPDIVKTNGSLICFLESTDGVKSVGRINIYSSNNGNPKYKTTVEPYDDVKKMRGKNWYCEVYNLYLNNKKLTAFCSVYSVSKENCVDCYAYALTYDLNDLSNIHLSGVYFQGGRYIDARLTGGKLILISSFSPYGLVEASKADKKTISLPKIGEYGKEKEIAAEKIRVPNNAADCSLAVISELDAENGFEPLDCTAVAGYSGFVYCTKSNLYLSAAFASDEYFSGDSKRYVNEGASAVSLITKISISNGLKYKANVKLNGRLLNQFALDEYKDKLRIAMGGSDSGYGYTSTGNYVCVFDKDLNLLGSTGAISYSKSPTAVFFTANTAYLANNQKEYLLIAVDLSDYENPRLLGQTEISEYTTFFVTVDDDRILSVGKTAFEDTFGYLSLVLSDISSPGKPKVLDLLKTKYISALNSDAKNTQRALVYNPKRDDYIIPLDNGMINIKIENGKIKLIDEYTVKGYSDDYTGFGTVRCVYIDDYIYLLNNTFDDDFQSKIDCVKYK